MSGNVPQADGQTGIRFDLFLTRVKNVHINGTVTLLLREEDKAKAKDSKSSTESVVQTEPQAFNSFS